ncbi:MAG TPA: tRNA lysidine(34) synthetase TilS [Atopostipes sp.]|nr:tRNA lysidine(34) synthetase TilS [Atopostipes sp.]
MFQDFKQILQSHNLLTADRHILLAVSGGVDSVVLFHLMQQLPKESRPQLSVAHINHQLRAEADEEEQYVKKLAEKYGSPFYSFHWEKKDHPDAGIEEAARAIRYSFFEKIMKEQNIDTLMTAHHQDDQVETILMKWTRGSTLAQLTGIRFSQSFAEGELVRPLLHFSKDTLYAFAKEQDLKYFEDATNFELTQTRNRFRNQIIPLLKKENAQFNQHVEQFALALGDVLEVSHPMIEEIFHQVVEESTNSSVLNLSTFEELTPAKQRLVLKMLLDKLYQTEGYQYKNNYVVLIQDWLLNGEVNTQLDLQNDILVKKEYNKVSFSKRKKQTTSVKDSEILIHEMNQWIPLSENEKIGLFLLDDNENIKDYMNDEKVLCIQEDSLKLPLTVRHRQAGDRMRYEGLNGSKKIKDIFIDEKTPLEERDQAWIVEDSSGEILWLISYRKRRLFTLEETDKLIYVLKYEKDEWLGDIS